MFGDIGAAELILIAIVALIVIGPEDLPDMFRQLGRFTAKLRSMSRDFSRAMEQAAKDTGVSDVAKDLKSATSPSSLGMSKVKEAADRFEKWDPIKNAAVPTKPLTTPAPAAPVAAAAVVEAATAPAVGPATAALYEKKAARKAVLDEASAKLKAIAEPVDATAPAPKAPGRRRKKPEAAGGEEA